MTVPSILSFRVVAPLSLALSLLGGACQASEGRARAVAGADAPLAVDSPEPSGAVMRAYDAPPGRAEALANVLQSVLRGTKEVPGIGKVTAMDGDRVVVVAPPGIHAGVEELCTALAEQPSASPRQRVEIQYWLLHARPSESLDASAVPELAAVLGEVATSGGPATYSRFEHATLASMLNAEAESSGARAQFKQTATAHDGGIVADVEIELGHGGGGRLRTRIAVQPGKTVVIGQNGIEGDDTRLLYVMRAELVDGA